MPGIDFKRVREQISIIRVLELIDYEPTRRLGDQLRGPCPIHGSTSRRSRSFSVDTRGNCFQCFKCGAAGNQLDLWANLQGLSIFEASKDLCQRMGMDIP
jgi:DNA primase